MSDETDVHVFQGLRWLWEPATTALRAFWKADDATGVEVLPPSEGYTTWMVVLPRGTRESLVELSDETAAWACATKARRERRS